MIKHGQNVMLLLSASRIALDQLSLKNGRNDTPQ